MNTSGFDAFISAVTSECGKARDAVAAELRKQGLRIAVQSDFVQQPASVTTLRKLRDLIRDSAEVHCLVGARSGACPPPEAAAEFAYALPDGITEASYTQWEYFFAAHYVPDRLWLYIAADAYPPDDATPAEPDRPDLQAQFRAYLGRKDPDHAKFSNIGELRAAVLSHRVRSPRAEQLAPNGGHAAMNEPFHRAVATSAIGGTIATVLGTALVWLASTLSGTVHSALVALLIMTILLGTVAFVVVQQRYAGILARQSPGARVRYEALRVQLARGGLPAHIYERRLSAMLDKVDRFFGDDGPGVRTLFPRAFGLRTPAPLWTAPAFDRCLLLALVYPVVVILLVWAIAGHVGPAERALLLPEHATVPQRWTAFGGMCGAAFCLWRSQVTGGWRRLLGPSAAAAVIFAVAFAVPVFPVFAFVFATASVLAGAGAGAGAGAVAFFVALVVAFVVAIAAAVTGVFAFAFAFVVAVVVAYLNDCAKAGGWQGSFQTWFIGFFLLACLAAPALLSTYNSWRLGGSLLLFLGLLTLTNAPFDWASLGLTRALLRRGLELGGWAPYGLTVVDALSAAGIIAVLTVFVVLGIQAFDTIAWASGGAHARLLPVDALLAGMAQHPLWPEYWWSWAMLFSTMIPSVVNLTIGGASLVRGIPWVTSALLKAMPPRQAPETFDRTWIALLLTSQWFIGFGLALIAQAILVWVVLWTLVPLFGGGLLELAQWVAEQQWPARLLLPVLNWLGW